VTFDPPHPVDVLKARGIAMSPATESELRRIFDEAMADFEHRLIYGASTVIATHSMFGESPLATIRDRLDCCREPDLPPPKPWIQKACKRAPKRLGMKR
jgi:hypothetical protein